jgi:cytochrome P450
MVVSSSLDLASDNVQVAQAFDLSKLPTGYAADPSPFFRLLRQHDPIHRNNDGSVLLTRYEDVRTVWRDLSGTVEKEELFRRKFGEGPLLEFYTTNMLFRDPPNHDRLRFLINPFFTRENIDRLHAPISEIIDRLLNEIADKREVDFVRDFSFLLPTEVICLLVGLPFQDGERLHKLGESILNPLNPNLPTEELAAGQHAAREFKEYLLEHLSRTRYLPDLDPGKNLLQALVAAERTGQEISEDEIIYTCILMFIGGHGTTMNMLSSSLHFLLENPDQLRDLRENPEIIDLTIEELIRYITPIQLQGRRTTRAVNISSGVLPPQTEVVLCGGSANRDESVFEYPDRLLLRRNPNPHIAFGAGIHFCVGRPLARLEVRFVLSQLFERFRNIERIGPAMYRDLPRFRSLGQLPLRFS